MNIYICSLVSKKNLKFLNAHLKSLNGSVVGMSTLPEIKEAGLLGLNVLTLSVITNFAAGISKTSLSHEEVLFNAKTSKHKMIKLLSGIIDKIT